MEQQNHDLQALVQGQPVQPTVATGDDLVAAEEADDIVSDDQIEGFASVEAMQSHHELQIMKLSDMNFELMDLNERLQAQLAERTAQVRMLGGIAPDSGRVRTMSAGTAAAAAKAASAAVAAARVAAAARPARLPPTSPDLAVPGPGTSRMVVNIWIPAAFVHGTGSSSHYVFQVGGLG